MKDLSRKDLKKQLDRVFSLYIRLRDCYIKGRWVYVKCPLCWKIVSFIDAQNMHFVKRSSMWYRYKENNCYAGCYGCNVALNWNYQQYTLFMISKYWMEKVEEMVNDKRVYKIKDYELVEMIDYYTAECIKIGDMKGVRQFIAITKYFSKKVLNNYWYTIWKLKTLTPLS